MTKFKVGDKVREKEWMGQFCRGAVLRIGQIGKVMDGQRQYLLVAENEPKDTGLWDDESNIVPTKKK